MLFFSVRWCLPRSENVGCSERREQFYCRGESVIISPDKSFVSSCAQREAYAHGPHEKYLSHRLTQWKEWSILLTWMKFDCFSFFGLGNIEDLIRLIWRLIYGSYSMSHYQWWFRKESLVQVEDARGSPQTRECSASDLHSAVLVPF